MTFVHGVTRPPSCARGAAHGQALLENSGGLIESRIRIDIDHQRDARWHRIEMAERVLPKARPEGRRERRRRETRAKLLKAAHIVMSRAGVEAATIKEITEEADIGFGTFYTYFETKEALATALLDCMIHDVVRRNLGVTEEFTHTAPETVPAVRSRLMLRTALSDPLWRWWALHPDMLFARLDRGLSEFAKVDVRAGVASGELKLNVDDVDTAWRLALWVMVGGLRDAAANPHIIDEDLRVVQAVLRLLGTPPEKAVQYTALNLPDVPPSEIDWDFALPDC
jgi:AcrR family transcriptional regulator